MTKVYKVKGHIEKIKLEEMAIAIKAMKLEKTSGPPKICAEMIPASAEVGISVMIELCQRV